MNQSLNDLKVSSSIPLWMKKVVEAAACHQEESDRDEKHKQVTAKWRKLAEKEIERARLFACANAERGALEELLTLGYRFDPAEVEFAGTRVHVYDRKEAGYYQAYKECARYMLSHPEMLNDAPKVFLLRMFSHVETVLRLTTSLPARQFFYNPMLSSIRKDVKALAASYGYPMPRFPHKTLKQLRDHLRDNQPQSAVTGNSEFRFIGGTHLQIEGRRPLLLRLKRGLLCVRIGGVDKNIYTLLAGSGVDRETADAWRKNSECVSNEIAAPVDGAVLKMPKGRTSLSTSSANKPAQCLFDGGSPTTQAALVDDSRWMLSVEEIDGLIGMHPGRGLSLRGPVMAGASACGSALLEPQTRSAP